jgi:hypothetical protein
LDTWATSMATSELPGADEASVVTVEAITGT